MEGAVASEAAEEVVGGAVSSDAETGKTINPAFIKRLSRLVANNCIVEGAPMTDCMWNKGKTILSLVLIVLLGVVAITSAMAAEGASEGAPPFQGKMFSSPDEAVKALIDACKGEDAQGLLAIFGPEGKEIISSGDEVNDKARRAQFLQDYEVNNRLEQQSPEVAILCVGKEDWPLPIPIVKNGDKWFFDAVAGKEEIINRRIGRNELEAVKVLRAYVDAQREYASEDRDGDGVSEFAQKFASEEGKKDGLYWPAKEGESLSPLGPFVAEASAQGYRKKEGGPTPYHGYCFKILHGQGKAAPGGEYEYVVNGKMILGYGLVAYPAEYGNSGITTFIVNQHDTVYEKDLGKDTATIASEMNKYDPGEGWKKVADEFLAVE